MLVFPAEKAPGTWPGVCISEGKSAAQAGRYKPKAARAAASWDFVNLVPSPEPSSWQNERTKLQGELQGA